MGRRYYKKRYRNRSYDTYHRHSYYRNNRVACGISAEMGRVLRWIINSTFLMISQLFKLAYKGIRSLVPIITDTINKRYKNFLLNHSKSLRALEEINSRYDFSPIPSQDILMSEYDNVVFYDNIDPKDYLTYQLIYRKSEILSAIKDANKNLTLLQAYQSETNKIQCFGEYDSNKVPKNRKKLLKMEKALFEKTQKTAVPFSVVVKIVLTNINGRYKSHKSEVFDSNVIIDIINRLDNKNDDFYLDTEIWDSICKVERGKVTNKVRFAVYQKYNHRCAKCGSTKNLEIDHIFPISKGGKSNFDNLQVLCHECNLKKSNTIEANAVNPKNAIHICPSCNVRMILKKGRYGDFYGCPNYPNCKHIEKL